MEGGVEDHRTIELDVKRPADHDGATREARNRTATKLWTISSSTNYVAVSTNSVVALKAARVRALVEQLISAAISPATDGTAELEIHQRGCQSNRNLAESVGGWGVADLASSILANFKVRQDTNPQISSSTHSRDAQWMEMEWGEAMSPQEACILDEGRRV
ncbi:hypothetical protein THAOC_28833 [Thalassiosira oceanica]|uniref:Uncharacterized protein n=1 Tax=Thalassiosira oceanica TaxID=159749 RepID=K0RZ59_THAOC|nr:hypothetical protein THAOC_28833 [Thalassiosira oceanica]|eukprot:EJK51947.1 hypothetical protein THAOC_28833 [Thalassiosira oceanica]